jgi:chemotaxis protein MotB
MRRRKPQSTFLLSLGDLIMVIMIFFIYLYSISEIDPMKFMELKKYFQKQMITKTLDNEAFENFIEEQEKIRQIERELEQLLKKENLTEMVTIERKGYKLFLTLGDSLLFRSAQSSVKPKSQDLLNKIGTLLKDSESRIIIGGHTDNLPINTDSFSSNWDLSLARAKEVFNYFSEAGLDEDRFVITGFGSTEALVENDTPKNRSINRRVTIVLEPELRKLTLTSVFDDEEKKDEND